MAFKNLKEDLTSLFGEYAEWEVDSVNQAPSLAGSDSLLRWSTALLEKRKDPIYKTKANNTNKISMAERRKDPVYRAKELDQQRIYRYNKKMKVKYD